VANFDDVGRPEPEPAVNEVETLRGFLNYQRATLKWKCEGLESAQMKVSVAKSAITLGGLLKQPWLSADFATYPDWEFESAQGESTETLFSNWNASVALSEKVLAETLVNGGLDQLAKRMWPSGESPSLRWILVHMIEEYARHNGHADFIRESIDGQTGE